MLELRERQRAVLVDKLFDLANLAAGAMVFGQFVAGSRYSVPTALVGMAIWLVLVVVAVALARR